MMIFNDFFHKRKLKDKATSNIKIHQVLPSIGLDKIGIYSRGGPFSSDIGIVNSHPSKGTHWVFYIHERYFDSYGITTPRKLFKFIIKQNGYCLYSEYKRQGLTSKRDNYCTSYCLYIFYLTKVIAIDFKTAVLNFYYQRFS